MHSLIISDLNLDDLRDDSEVLKKAGKHTCKIERSRGTNRTKITGREIGCLKE